MARSTLLYLGLLVFLGGGFEGIRRLGSTLTPPRHIAGAWRVTVPSSPSPCPVLEFNKAGDAGLQVEQSGRYLTLTFTDARHTRLRARFHGGELRGGGPSTIPCAVGKEVHVAGRLTDNTLELILNRPQDASTPTAPALVLSATRPSGAGPRPSPFG